MDHQGQSRPTDAVPVPGRSTKVVPLPEWSDDSNLEDDDCDLDPDYIPELVLKNKRQERELGKCNAVSMHFILC